MKFEYTRVAEWPCLAWLAAVDEGSSVVTVFHGPWVETRREWFCEAVWAGELEAGGFDRTDIVAGSGARLRGGRLVFVSSGNTVDRLSSLRTGGRTWVSNSLCCLLAAVDGSLDPAYPEYFRDLRTIMFTGLRGYKRHLESSRGPVLLTYHHNLVWTGSGLVEEEKPGTDRVWRNYDEYRTFLLSAMEAVAGNMAAAGRQRTYRMVGALSRGYDSPTVTAVASRFGCEDAICFTRSRDGEDDNGAPLAPYLKVRAWELASDAWRGMGAIEGPFLAGDPGGTEMYMKAAEPLLAGRVLLGGYFGDHMWSKAPRSQEPIFLMGASSLSLTEYRLAVGFFNCPPAYWGGRLLRQTAAISNSDEMKPWDIPGPYSRPICRRLLEEAGVPQELFGQRKQRVAVLSHLNEFLNDPSYRDYLEWLRGHRADWRRLGRIPPLRSPRADRGLRNTLNLAWRGCTALGLDSLSRRLLYPVYLRRYVFPWAVERMKARFSPPAVASLRSAAEGATRQAGARAEALAGA